jgi:hypothetical protein
LAGARCRTPSRSCTTARAARGSSPSKPARVAAGIGQSQPGRRGSAWPLSSERVQQTVRPVNE